jgi:hypothetical protein
MSKVQTMYALTKRVEIIKQLDKIKTYFSQERECVVTADMDRLIDHVKEIGYLAKALGYPVGVMKDYDGLLSSLRAAAEGTGLNKAAFEDTGVVVFKLIAFIESEINMIVN